MSTDTAAIAEDFAAIFATNARNVLKAAVGRPCQCEVSPGGEPLAALPDAGVLRLQIAFSGALEGSLNLLLTQADGALLADLLMMGDGTAAWNDEQFDALKEIGNQLAGSLATNLGERWSTHVGNAGASCEAWDKGATPGAIFAFAKLFRRIFPLFDRLGCGREEILVGRLATAGIDGDLLDISRQGTKGQEFVLVMRTHGVFHIL